MTDREQLPPRNEAVDLLKQLLRLDTSNPPGNERPAAELLARLFQSEGIEHTIVEAAPGRANVVARLRGRGAGPGPLLLSGHLDVVPVDRDQWSRNPFGAEEADGCIWGRGAIDMKHMVAMSAMCLVALRRSGVELGRDVIFAGVADEEAGSHHGALHLVEHHPELVRAEFVLNEVGGHTLYMGESRFYPVQVSEKGICWLEIVARGEPGHGSMPHPNNAVVRLSRALAALGSARLPQHTTHVVSSFLRALAERAPFPQNKLMPLMLQPRLSGALLDQLQKRDPEKARGIGAMLRNTATPTMFEAGRKVNVIPSEARARVDGRLVPGQSVEQFLSEVREVIGEDFRLEVLEHHDGVTFDTKTSLYDAIVRTMARHDPGSRVVPYMIPGFTDSFAYARLGATCYGFAPVKLPADLAFSRMFHGHDERIPRDGFEWGFEVLHELVRDFAAA